MLISSLLLRAVLNIVSGVVYYDTYTGKQITDQRRQWLAERNLTRYCVISVEPCNAKEGRRVDGSCNNLHYPPRGATLTPYLRLLPGRFGKDYDVRSSKSGRELPPPRVVRTSLISDGKVSDKHFTQLVTYFMTALVAEMTSLHDTINYVLITTHCCLPGGQKDPRCIPIDVPNDDPYLRLTEVRCLNQTRAITYQFVGCVSDNIPPERINTATPMLDQSMIYGNTADAIEKARLYKGGLLKYERDSQNRTFPPSGGNVCLNNRLPTETRCHDTPNVGTNALIGVNLYSVWFYREHNRLARKLGRMNRCWDDEQLFTVARQINIATQQYIYIYEVLGAIMGYENSLKYGLIFNTNGFINEYDENLEPRVSIEFVSGLRWFHIMQDGQASLYTPEGKYVGRRTIVDDIFRTGILELNNTIDELTQGSFRQSSGKPDYIVDPDIGERVIGDRQRASDVVSSDINKNRDLGIPPYNEYRKLCGMRVAKTFHDFLDVIDKERVEILSRLYEDPDDVDLQTGILSERLVEGGFVGPTLFCIMADQIKRWRRADRFWFERGEHHTSFTAGQLYQFKKTSMARILCDNGDSVTKVQPRAFQVIGPNNELVKCKHISYINLNDWKDFSCALKPDLSRQNKEDAIEEPENTEEEDSQSPETMLIASLLLGAVVNIVSGVVYYDTYTGKEITDQRRQWLAERNLTRYCTIGVEPCNAKEGRRVDGTCNNLHYPPRGATLTPYLRLLPGRFGKDYDIRPSKSGRELPPPRVVRTSLISDGKVSDKHFTQLVTYFMTALVGEMTSLHDTVNYVILTIHCCLPGGQMDPRCIPIDVPNDDPYLRLTDVRCLNQTRAITYQFVGCVSDNIPPERINTATPMLDQSIIYGNTADASEKARLYKGGLLKYERDSQNRTFPPSGGIVCLNNRLPWETRCHDTPNVGANSLIGVNLYSVWFYREHNRLARKLGRMNPCWDDEQLFTVARQINIASQQYIYTYELLGSIMGYENSLKYGLIFNTNGFINDYDETLEPRVSIEFVSGTRWFHIMQDGHASLYTPEGKYVGRRTVVDDTVRTGILELNNTIDELTQGCFRQSAGKLDYIVDPDVGERILGGLQKASDVISSDINKSRDLGIPPYNEYRKLCGMRVAKTFHDFLDVIDKERVEILSRLYEDPDDVDLQTGILSERLVEGGFVGPTLFCIMADQIRRWRRADRFWFERGDHPTSFTAAQLYQIKKTSMARILCDNGDSVTKVQPRAFQVIGPNNELVSCRHIGFIDLNHWKDFSCALKPNLSRQNKEEVSEEPESTTEDDFQNIGFGIDEQLENA